MNIFENIKLKHMARGFENGFFKCDQCSYKNTMSGPAPLSVVQCEKCGYGNFVPVKIGGFWLFEPLGGGGMGSVYKGFNAGLGGLCAVKVLPRDGRGNPEFIEDLERESGVLKTIGNHRNIVRLAAAGNDGDELYCAMEFINGSLLSTLIEDCRELPEARVLEILMDLLAAEKHIFSKGFLYRDIKPQNVMIRNDGSAVLFDFGVCLPVYEAAEPPAGDLVEGSPFYLPPERMWRSGEGQESEIYSLGMVAYHALTGKTFFKSQDDAEKLAKKHASGLRVTITHAMMPQCSRELVVMLEKMIRKEPEERFQTFEELETEIRKIIKK